MGAMIAMSEEIQKNSSDASADVGTPKVVGAASPARGKKRRRWLKITIVVLVLLLVLVWSIPYLLSTPPGTALVVGIINGGIKGEVAIDDLSLRWLGDCCIHGLRLKDPEGREVVNVGSLTLGAGVLKLAGNAEEFGRLEVGTLAITLYLDENWSPSLLRAIESPTPSEPSPEPSPAPKPIGEITLNGGTITVVKADGSQYGVQKIEGRLTLDTLNSIVGSFAMEPEGGGQFKAMLEVKGLAAGGTVSPDKATGSIVLETPSRVQLGPLVTWVTGADLIQVGLDIKATGAPGPGAASGDCRIGWETATAYGMTAGASELKLQFNDSRLVLSETVIPVSGGKARLLCIVDFSGPTPVASIPGKLQMLEDIALNKAVGSQLLGRVNPIFIDPEGISGTLSLRTEDVRVPLSPAKLNEGRAKAKLSLKGVSYRAGGILMDILRLRGDLTGDPVKIKDGDIALELRDGRLHYDDLTVKVGSGYELVFSGSVGLDSSLDLKVGVPVTEGLLARLGVKQNVAQYVRLLKRVRIDIPIVGTRELPQLDLGGVDIVGILKKAAGSAVEGEVRDRLDGLLNDLLKPR